MWLKELRENATPNIKIILVGNKCDLESDREVKKEEAKEFAKKYKLDFCYEVSAKEGINVEQLFVKITKLMYRDYRELYEMKGKKRVSKIKLKDNDMGKSDGCAC